MREEVAGRPLLAASLALIIGLSAPDHPANLCLAGLLFWLVSRRLGGMLAVSGALLIGLLFAPSLAKQSSTDKNLWVGAANIISSPALSARGETCLVETDKGIMRLIAISQSDLALGQRLEIHGVLLKDDQSHPKTDADGTILCRENGLRILQRGSPWFEAVVAWRNSFVHGVDEALSPNESALVNALCFAVSSPLPSAIKRNLTRTGAVHIISASGLQVFLLALLTQFLIALAPVRRAYQVGIVLAVLLAYASGSGMHPSTIRAVLMAALAAAAFFFRREPDYLSGLGFAAIVTALWQPWTIYTPGFQLSYATVAALALYWRRYVPQAESKVVDRVLQRIWIVLRTSLVAALAASPIAAYHYGEFSVISPITNLLIAPAVPVIIAVSMFAWPLGFLLPALRIGLLKIFAAPLAAWILAVTELFGRQPWAAVSCPSFNAYLLLLYYGGFLLLWNRRGR